jgi:hypothetical protein
MNQPYQLNVNVSRLPRTRGSFFAMSSLHEDKKKKTKRKGEYLDLLDVVLFFLLLFLLMVFAVVFCF